MVDIELNGQTVGICPNCSSKYTITEGQTLEQIIQAQFNPYAFTYENIERELAALLLRAPTEAEINSCLG